MTRLWPDKRRGCRSERLQLLDRPEPLLFRLVTNDTSLLSEADSDCSFASPERKNRQTPKCRGLGGCTKPGRSPRSTTGRVSSVRRCCYLHLLAVGFSGPSPTNDSARRMHVQTHDTPVHTGKQLFALATLTDSSLQWSCPGPSADEMRLPIHPGIGRGGGSLHGRSPAEGDKGTTAQNIRPQTHH